MSSFLALQQNTTMVITLTNIINDFNINLLNAVIEDLSPRVKSSVNVRLV
jgi:hypothetical protein